MTAAKNSKNLPEVETTPIAAEVEAENAESRVFTIEVNGKSVDLVDKWDRPGFLPPISILTGNSDLAMKMSGPIIAQMIGEEQMLELAMQGASQEELFSVVSAWIELHDLKN